MTDTILRSACDRPAVFFESEHIFMCVSPVRKNQQVGKVDFVCGNGRDVCSCLSMLSVCEEHCAINADTDLLT